MNRQIYFCTVLIFRQPNFYTFRATNRLQTQLFRTSEMIHWNFMMNFCIASNPLQMCLKWYKTNLKNWSSWIAFKAFFWTRQTNFGKGNHILDVSCPLDIRTNHSTVISTTIGNLPTYWYFSCTVCILNYPYKKFFLIGLHTVGRGTVHLSPHGLSHFSLST